jgi:chemotaxis protein methyltransferase CheR
VQDHEFSFIQKMVRDEAGLVLESGKAYLAEIRLSNLARETGCSSISELILQLRGTPPNGLHRQVVESLLIHETRFFRDENAFELLKRTVLPNLLSRPNRGAALGVWSAGCSSGQEPYSLAMLLQEELPPDMRARILATDVSESVLARAREGVFNGLEVNRGLPPEYRSRYFAPTGQGEWKVVDRIRHMIDFRLLNLVKDWGPVMPMDIVFLRNVMIYFDVATKKTILNRLRKVMRPGGYLFLGGAESALMLDSHFRMVQKDRSWCYQLPAA